jgi:hypothetical protein
MLAVRRRNRDPTVCQYTTMISEAGWSSASVDNISHKFNGLSLEMKLH